MSATGRGGKRNPDDFYETPAWAVLRFLEKFCPPSGRWLEPGAGNGAIIRAVDIRWPRWTRWTAVDLRPRPAGFFPRTRWIRRDFLSWKRRGRRFDFAMGNPPYLLAQEFAEQCFRWSDVTALLLRLNFAGSSGRHLWFMKHPADMYILPDRPSYCTKVKCSRCGWTRTLPAGAPAPMHPGSPSAPAACAGKVVVTRTDATEYAWFVWGDGAGVSRDPKVVWLDRTPMSERGGKR